MCRLLAWASDEACRPGEVLTADELRSLAGLARFHADGWGMTGLGGERVWRSTAPAADDAEFSRAMSELKSRAGLLHLRRATPGYAVAPENTHPFILDGWAFAHNGTISDDERLEGLLAPRWRQRRRGTTDSERYFLAFLERLERSADPLAALNETVASIREACGANGLNAVLCSETHLIAVQAAAGSKPDRASLIALMGAEVADPSTGIAAEHLEDYFGLRYQRRAGRLVVASTGIGGPRWEALLEDSLLVADLAQGTIACYALGEDEPQWRTVLGSVEHPSVP